MKLIREHINFERGLDPKKSMATGRYGIEAEIKLLSRWGSSYLDKDTVYYEIASGSTDNVCIKVGNKRKIFPLIPESKPGRSKYIFQTLSEQSSKIWKRISKIAWDMGAGFYKDAYYNKINIEDPYKIQESINFQRGLDPKDAMKTGMTNEYPQWNLFHLLYQEASNSENFIYVTPINYEANQSFRQIFHHKETWVEPSFSIESKFIHSMGTSGRINDKYSLYLTKNEGIILSDDNTGDVKEIIDLKMFDKVTKCYDQ